MFVTSSACRSDAILTSTANLIRAQPPSRDVVDLLSTVPGDDDWIHVSEEGSDEYPNNGTAKFPYKTIRFAMSKLQGPGQGLLIAPGTYAESGLITPISGTADKPIWIKGLEYPAGPRTTILGSGGQQGPCPNPLGEGQPVNIFTINQSYWILDGLEIDANSECYRPISIGVPTGAVTAFAVVNNLDVHGATGPQAVRVTNAHDVFIVGSKIHDNWWAPAGQEKDCHGINVLQDSDRVLIRQNCLRGHSGDSIQVAHSSEPHNPDPVNPDKGLPRNITIDSNDFTGDFENAIDLKSCRNVTILSNQLHDYLPSPPQKVGTSAIVIHYDARGVLIENNELRKCGRAVSIEDLGLPANPERRMGPIVLKNNELSEIQVTSTVPGTGSGITVNQVAGIKVGDQDVLHAVEIYDNMFTNIDRVAIEIGGNGAPTRVVRPLVANNVFNATKICMNINPAAISEREVGDPACQGNPLRSGLTSNHNQFKQLQSKPFRRLGEQISLAQWQVCYDSNSCVDP